MAFQQKFAGNMGLDIDNFAAEQSHRAMGTA
jgi:hypothetical protein